MNVYFLSGLGVDERAFKKIHLPESFQIIYINWIKPLPKENISDYKGFYQNNPFLTWIFALALFSLAGIPPTAGFFGKLFLLSSGAQNGTYLFIGIAAINMIVSLYYYLRIIRAMFMDKNENPISKLELQTSTKIGLIICGIGIIVTGLFGQVYDYIQHLVN